MQNSNNSSEVLEFLKNNTQKQAASKFNLTVGQVKGIVWRNKHNGPVVPIPTKSIDLQAPINHDNGQPLKCITALLQREDLTQLEKQVIVAASDLLETWIGKESYSCESFQSLHGHCEYLGFKMSMNSLKGVVGSLVKKEILFTYERDEDEFFEDKRVPKWRRLEFVFVDQFEMER